MDMENQQHADTDLRDKVHTTEGIAALLREYYKDLYNLPSPQSDKDKATEKKAIQVYLRNSGLSQIPEDDLSELDKPISTAEVTMVMAQMQLGKAPGPFYIIGLMEAC